jgi:Na+/phosphate symporter
MLKKISVMEVANTDLSDQERQRTQALLDIADALKKIATSASEIQKDLKAIASKR